MSLRMRAIVLSLIPIAVLSFLIIADYVLQGQVSLKTARLHRATEAEADVRDIADNRQFASLALRRMLYHDRAAVIAYRNAVGDIQSAMARVPALAGPDPGAIEAATRVLKGAAVALTMLRRIDAQVRQGHFSAASAALADPAYNDSAEHVSVAARAFIAVSRASQAEYFASLNRLGSASLLLLVLALGGLVSSSVLLVHHIGSAVQAILDVGRKSKRYWRGEPLGEPSARRDEIGQLDAALYEFVAQIDEYATALEARAQASDEKFRTSEDIRETFSTAFVPRPLPEIAGFIFDAVYLPADEESRVGGDWYDIVELDNDDVLISIGDVTGHGAAAALSTVRLREAIIGSALEEREPGAILHRAARVFALTDDSVATALLVILDKRSQRIRYASAGHPAPILATVEDAKLLPGGPGIPLGIDPEMRYESFEHTVLDGELLLLYSDGLIEAHRTIIEDELRLLAAAQGGAAGACDACGIALSVLGTTAIPDDVALLTFRTSGRGARRHLDVLKCDSGVGPGCFSETARVATH